MSHETEAPLVPTVAYRLLAQGEEPRLGGGLLGREARPRLPDRPEQRNDLWRTAKMFDYGPERNLEVWTEAMHMLAAFAEMAMNLDNDALQVALVDCHERAKEEVLDLAWAEVEMRIAVIQGEQEILWTW